MKKYRVTWGEFSYTQGNLSKTEALKLASELLNQYDSIKISIIN
jgi:hypothetical protein